MSELNLRFKVFVPINLENSGDPDSPKWNMLCCPVKSKSHADGDFELNTSMFHDAVRNFQLRSTKKLPINFDHFSPEHPNYDPTKGAPKQGNVIDMQVRADGCLWGLCDFKEPAKTYVNEGKYEHFSPEILLDSLDRETGKRVGMRLKGVALVTDPHLYEMPPVRASDENRNVLTETEELDKTKEESMSKELENKISELTNKVSELEVQLKGKDVKIAELALEHKTKLSELQLSLDNKTKQYDELVKEAVDGEIELVFNTYKDSRGLSDEDKAHLKTLRLANAASFRKCFPIKPAEVKTTPRAANPTQRPAYLQSNLSNETRVDPPADDSTNKPTQIDLYNKYRKEGMDNMQATLRAAKEGA